MIKFPVLIALVSMLIGVRLGSSDSMELITLTRPPFTKVVIKTYVLEILRLSSKPERLDSLSPTKLYVLQQNISGEGIAYKLTAGEARLLRKNETELIASILQSLTRRIDLRINLAAGWPSGLDDPQYVDKAKEQEYETLRAEQIRESRLASDQIQLRNVIRLIVQRQKVYLGILYPAKNELLSALKATGANDLVVKLLTHSARID
jgi:hypothetical protein